MCLNRKAYRTIAFFLTVLLLFQSCVAYRTVSTLEEASQQRMRTKITTTDFKALKYKYITYENGQYYGIKLESGEWIKTPLDQKDISKVAIENKKASTFLTVAVFIPTGIFLIALVNYFSEPSK